MASIFLPLSASPGCTHCTGVWQLGLPSSWGACALCACVFIRPHWKDRFTQGGANEHIAEARRFLGLNPTEPPILSGNSEFSWKAQITGDIRRDIGFIGKILKNPSGAEIQALQVAEWPEKESPGTWCWAFDTTWGETGIYYKQWL